MFKSARLKLTLWYLLIVMFISFFFSGLIYIGTVRELERGFRWGEIRLKARELDIPLPRRFPRKFEDLPSRLKEGAPRFLLSEELETAKKRIGFRLLILNCVILVFSAGASWFLAGKTLKPIEQSLEEQKRFVADASHELRSPLTALKTSMEVALRDKKITLLGAKKLIKENLEEVDGLIALSNRLLDLARYQTNNQNLIFEKVDIKEVIKEVLKKISPLAKKKKIKIIQKTKSQKIKADREGLTEMLLIFLDNAIKFTPEGGKVSIKTAVGKKNLFLEIEDTGIGINQKDLPHIFERFYRAESSRSKEKIGGFGLGLALAKRIIEIHKGSVAVKSEVGVGTTFTIKFPLKNS